MSTAGKTAIVTGSSRGIGKAVAERLAKDGFSVVVNYSGDAAAAEETVTAIKWAGGKAIAFKADVADEVAVAAMFDAAEAEFGGIDVVVNSAGIMVLSPIAELKLEDLDRMHRINIRGTFVVNQQAARRVRHGGAIVNLSTSVEKQAIPGYAAYAASKGAVEAIGMILARELRGRRITVNTVAPGPTATDLFLKGKDDALIAQMAKLNPMERLGTPEDIAEVISFLAGRNTWINGQVLYANGGMN
ncbi:SDR family oxidoreductase [Neorhizobium alkalisoli]|uniref:3-oxoacyl-[acyl-carrier protein] reductase n=1 Tax=Neorhizobium alkalisoli TaxID=528178 RepID=A0A561R363_9HYPH|nr:SDR family oxidoreductase [Neorhizobium alkalisoli]TWF57054.1 3-oxoacyl-[acyl-carrier protein] reductase [Neorhizobium alkalisoli]